MKMREIKIFLKKLKIKGWNMKKNTIFALRFLIKNVSKSKGSEKVIKKIFKKNFLREAWSRILGSKRVAKNDKIRSELRSQEKIRY